MDETNALLRTLMSRVEESNAAARGFETRTEGALRALDQRLAGVEGKP